LATEQDSAVAALSALIAELPEELRCQALTHSSWTERRVDSFERLAFLGDSVLALSVTRDLYPRLEARRSGAGRLTKIRAQVVSRRSCATVARRLGIDRRLAESAPDSAPQELTRTESVLAEVMEAVIGACFLHFGFETTADGVAEAFEPEIVDAMAGADDFKSSLQELLARRGQLVAYRVIEERGPPHDRVFEVAAIVEDREVGRGSGRSKKDAEQAAAQSALEELDPDPDPDAD
jgi:ribonuclease-3